jgi:hypothetical protein
MLMPGKIRGKGMTTDHRIYWGKVRTKQAELDKQFPSGFCLIVSIDGVRTCEADNANSARCIVDSTHRLATPDEAVEHRRDQELKRSQSLAADGGLTAARRMFQALQPQAKGPGK